MTITTPSSPEESEKSLYIGLSKGNSTEGSIQDLLASRDHSHGDYKDTARIAQQTKELWHSQTGWGDLDACQKETLDMFATKIGRILAGDQNFRDSWVDLTGYSQLIVNRIKP